MPGTCPFGIPVVALAPQTVHGFSWGPVIRPQGDACLGAIAVEPADDLAWYVGSISGLYMTKDGGQTWKKPVGGSVGPLLIVPGRPTLVYAGVGDALYLSRDAGKSWTRSTRSSGRCGRSSSPASGSSSGSTGALTRSRAASTSRTSAAECGPSTPSAQGRRG